ncbi:MAG: Stp1/IreP family PP2C-type Ser/Thr phosphatase [Peptoniphilaceae bacterium]|nr:Stp1/IreP family PP2C-type Ser/Thr phosphatase [Peptoniphilaceae bacterium]MDD7382847.1 Stp1/IreP family PP2C-type Ser/Thr phosphatase [Peptoniphilaceae bacterium]MDY3738194.1 Stp1/IreP family PP2C-type Ser/Thr phosphatase [Peptoniphilaceae bacterium]
MEYSSISNIGKVRHDNQDYYGSVKKGKNRFFIVADGMGGYKGGEIASKLAVNSFLRFIEENDSDNLYNLQEDALSYSNTKVYEESKKNEEYSLMGTTVVCVCIDVDKNLLHFSHIGDSRAYLFRDNTLKQITRDHSLVNDLLDSGSLTPEEAKNYKNKNTITRAVGSESKIKIDSISFEMQKNDIILLVTDGLTDEVGEKEIIEIVSKNKSSEEISSNLVDLAIENGGHDNITITTILMR